MAHETLFCLVTLMTRWTMIVGHLTEVISSLFYDVCNTLSVSNTSLASHLVIYSTCKISSALIHSMTLFYNKGFLITIVTSQGTYCLYSKWEWDHWPCSLINLWYTSHYRNIQINLVIMDLSRICQICLKQTSKNVK